MIFQPPSTAFRSGTEVCRTSIDILRERCLAYLAPEIPGGKFWFADHSHAFPESRGPQPVDVILFGGFAKKILENTGWNASRVRLWTLSRAAQDALFHLFQIPKAKIGVLPRYGLFPAPGRHSVSFPEFSKPFTLVCSGRISPNKNIETLLRVVSLLQTEHGIPAKLVFCGTFDGQPHPDIRGVAYADFGQEIAQLVDELPWSEPPRFLGALGPWEWPRLPFERPVLVSFSTYICEDFDVSLAQAQAAGWPCIVTDWGGHRDVTGTAVYRIHPSLVGHSHEIASMISMKARKLAARLADFMKSKPSPGPGSGGQTEDPLLLPVPLAKEDLAGIRSRYRHSTGADGELFLRLRGYEEFALTPAGTKFFSKYRSSFSGTDREENSAVILVNNLDESLNTATRGISKVCEFCYDAFDREGLDVKFLPLETVFSKKTLWQVLSAKRLIFPFYYRDLTIPVFRTLVTRWGVAAPIEIFVNRELDHSGIEELSALLRPSDRLHFFTGEGEDLRDRLPQNTARATVSLR